MAKKDKKAEELQEEITSDVLPEEENVVTETPEEDVPVADASEESVLEEEIPVAEEPVVPETAEEPVPEESFVAEPEAEEPAAPEEPIPEEIAADAEEPAPEQEEEATFASPEDEDVAEPPVLPVFTSEEAEEPAPEPIDEGKKEPAPKSYTRAEKKLRRKYKMEKDPILKENGVVSGFVIAKGEKVIRTYRCLSAPKGDGTICLTNRRLLVNAGERSEVGIDQVSGIKFSKYSRFYFLKALFALLFTVVAAFCILLPLGVLDRMNIHVASLVTGETRTQWAVILSYIGGGIAAIIALALWCKVIRKTFYFYIYARQESPFVECKSESYYKREKKGKVSTCMLAKAGKESEKAARELGALIIEVKEGRFDD